MSVLNKLQIRGIRSFDPKEEKAQVIQFFAPVTLIVGHNGCGKTTIIEALKYAITNSFPPGTDNGKYFINDPKLGSGYEVLGQVTLELTSSDGSVVHVSRRMKSTQKSGAKKASFQSLEGTMRVIRNGRKVDMSSKCSDMKVEMCRMMGVSDSILNFVIFCHQEDSCWPLDEGKKVKERFDAIFNTTGYILALKQLDLKEKDVTAKMKTEQNSLKYAEAAMEIVRKKKKDLTALENQMAMLTDSDGKYAEEQEELVQKLREVEKIEQDVAKHTANVSVSKERVRSGEEQVEELRQDIKEEFQGDLQELENVLQDFQRSGRKKAKEIEKLTSSLTQLDRDLANLRSKQQNLLLQEGKFKQSEESNDLRLKTLQGLGTKMLQKIRKMKQDFSTQDLSVSLSSTIDALLTSEPSSLDPDQISKAIHAAIRAKETEFSKVKATLDARERELQGQIDQLRSQQASLVKDVEIKKEQIGKNKMSVDDLRGRLNVIEGSNDRLANLDQDEKNFAAKIQQIEESGVIGKCEGEIMKVNEEVKVIREEADRTQKLVDLLVKDKSITDQVEFCQRQKLQKVNECSEIMRRIDGKLAEIFDEDVPTVNLGSELDTKIKNLKSEMATKQKEMQVKQREQSRFTAELGQVSRELNKKQREVQVFDEQVQDLVDNSDFLVTYEKVKTDLEKEQEKDSMAEAAQFLYKQYIQKLSKKPCCPLCKRDFERRNQAEALKNDMEKKVKDMLDSRPRIRENLERLKRTYQQFIELKPLYEENARKKEEEIPQLKESKSELERKKSGVQEELDGLDCTLGLVNHTCSEAQGLVKDVTLLEQNQKEAKRLEANVAGLENKRDPQAVASTTTLPDAQASLESLQSTLQAKQLEKESKETLRSRKKDELDSYRTRRNKIQEQKLQITSEMQNREALETQKRDLEQSSKALHDLISDLNSKIPTLRAQITAAEHEKSEFLKQKDGKLSRIREEKDAFQIHGTKLAELRKQIEEFELSKVKFSEVKKLMSECKGQVEKVEAQIGRMREELDELKNQVTAHDVKERDLQDNLKLLQKLEELTKLRADLSSKEKLLREVEKRGSVGNQKRELSRQYERVTAKLNESKGKSSELKKNIRSIQDELGGHYKNTESDYRERLVSATVYDRAQSDIRKFKKALDHAIMTFHSKRMENINKSLKRYWQQVYKGNDIDYIQIRTQDEDAAGKEEQKVELKAARKSYNYRVVMIKRGVELDMRGRCSAGQKVLACIIIRVSLAEAFSAKCGIIALDEPTTNLDEANISALADMLNALSMRMSKTKTFQLILITHDEPFIARLLEIGGIEAYYKLRRNDNGYSQIVQVRK